MRSTLFNFFQVCFTGCTETHREGEGEGAFSFFLLFIFFLSALSFFSLSFFLLYFRKNLILLTRGSELLFYLSFFFFFYFYRSPFAFGLCYIYLSFSERNRDLHRLVLSALQDKERGGEISGETKKSQTPFFRISLNN